MIKILSRDKNSYVVHFKLLEGDRFQLPVVDEGLRSSRCSSTASTLNAKRLARWNPPSGIDSDPDRDPTGRWSCLPSIMSAHYSASPR
jgi:hypothetical protein